MPEREKTMTTVIHVQPRIWSLLRQLAGERTLQGGGRPSVSAVVTDLVVAAAAKKAAHPTKPDAE
jgi:hypothetical protein